MDLSPSDIEAALNQSIPAAFERFRTSTLKKVFPVGSIYISLTANTNPATLLGFGTWEALPAGRCLVSQGTGYDAGATGGSATKTLTTANMPAHTHSVTGSTGSAGGHTHTRGTMNITGGVSGGSGTGSEGAFYHAWDYGVSWYPEWSRNDHFFRFDASRSWSGETSSAGAHTHTITCSASSAGSGEAFNVEQPYLVVYMWKRTA